MATYALAVPTAVVVDVGSTKTTVSCIEDGVLMSNTVIKKHMGGDD